MRIHISCTGCKAALAIVGLPVDTVNLLSEDVTFEVACVRKMDLLPVFSTKAAFLV